MKLHAFELDNGPGGTHWEIDDEEGNNIATVLTEEAAHALAQQLDKELVIHSLEMYYDWIASQASE